MTYVLDKEGVHARLIQDLEHICLTAGVAQKFVDQAGMNAFLIKYVCHVRAPIPSWLWQRHHPLQLIAKAGRALWAH